MRRLSDEQIAMIEKWVQQGIEEGDPTRMPPPPRFDDGWQLGAPDLVVKMPKPYVLPARGRDVFRNFVIPVDVPATRFVKAVEPTPWHGCWRHIRINVSEMQRRQSVWQSERLS